MQPKNIPIQQIAGEKAIHKVSISITHPMSVTILNV